MEWALAGVGQRIEHGPVNQRVAGLIPTQGTCLGCGPGPRWEGMWKTTTHWCFSPSLSPTPPLSLKIKINKIKKEWNEIRLLKHLVHNKTSFKNQMAQLATCSCTCFFVYHCHGVPPGQLFSTGGLRCLPSPGDIWQCPETFLVVTTGEGECSVHLLGRIQWCQWISYNAQSSLTTESI